MGDAVAISVQVLDQLKPYLNKDGVLEIVQRGLKGRFKKFLKVALEEMPKVEKKANLQNVLDAVNKNTEISDKILKQVVDVASSQKIGLLLNGLNLCATVAGFAIMYDKLEKMSAEIGQQINKLQNTVEKGNDVQAVFEFNKVLGEHSNMLDCRRKKQPYSEDKLRELVDREYNVLSLLISIFQKEITGDRKTTIFSIFSLLAMFTVSLRSFDEIYYANNHEVLGEEDAWHTSHSKWMGVYSTLSSPWFVEKLQDYAMLESDMSTMEADIYYTSLMDQVYELKEEIEDNQKLIVNLGDIELLHVLRTMNNAEIQKTVSNALAEASDGNPSPELEKLCNNAIQQIAFV